MAAINQSGGVHVPVTQIVSVVTSIWVQLNTPYVYVYAHIVGNVEQVAEVGISVEYWSNT